MAQHSIISSKESTKRTFVSQEKTGFDKFSSDLKESIFQVLYLILKDEDSSLFMFFIGVAADYLQNLAFCFNEKILSVWKATSLLDIVFNFFNFFQPQTYFGDAYTFQNYLIIFYLIVGMLIIVFINIIYVSYAFSKKRVSAIWPVVLLRSSTSLVFTLFFLPLTELLVQMLQCETNDEGQYVLGNFENDDVPCFQGAHILHGIVAIIIMTLFTLIGFIVALACFEVRMLTEDLTARQHSRGDVYFTLNKISLQLAFAFFSNQWILVAVFLIGAIVLWVNYNKGEPYYVKECTIFFRILTTYYLWTAFMMSLSKLLENSSFTGGLMAWIVGLPFIGGIMLTSSKSKASSLTQTTSKFKTSEDLLDHLRFVLQLIDTHQSDRNSSILLTGYIEKHKDTCEEDDCPLKLTKKRRLSTAGNSDELDEVILGLTLVVDRMYQQGIKKFRTSVKLRVAYCVFLIERMKKTKKAEQELKAANDLKPGFEDQFIIYRLSKMINDGMEGVDVVGLIAWENYKNLYIEYIKESANLHREFWLELKEDKPDLMKLNYLGSKVNNAMNYAKDYMTRLRKIRNDDPLILRTYGRFLIDIQNDVVEGLDLLQKAKKLLTKKIHYQIQKKASFEAGTDEYPYVEVVGNGNEMGIIKQANLLFTILVGVNRDEIIGKKINNFMPEIFATYHDTFLKNYNTREEEVDIKYLDNDNELFVRSKSGYIIPITLRVTRLKTEEASNQITFGAWLRNENVKKSYVYFICQPDGTIMDMTATAVTVLNLTINQVKKTKMNIDKIIPGALTDKGFRERGKEVLYNMDSNTSFSLTAIVLPIKLRDERNRDFKDLYQSLNPGKPLLSMSDGIYTYIVRVEKIEKAFDFNNSGTGEFSRNYTERGLANAASQGGPKTPTNLLDNSMSNRGGQSRGDHEEKGTNDGQIIYGFNTENVGLEITELFQKDGMRLDFENLMKGETLEIRPRMNYGVGISLKKYSDGRLYEINEDHMEREEAQRKEWEEEADEDSLFLKEDDDLNVLDVKKRKDKLSSLKRLVRDALETNKRNAAISNLKSLTCLWLISIITIGIIQFVFLKNLLNDYTERLHILQLHTEKITEISKITSVITDFLTLNSYPIIETNYAETNVTQRQIDLQTSVNRIVTLIGDLSDEKSNKFIDTFDDLTIPLTIYSANGVETLTLSEPEAIFLITSRAYALHLMDINNQFNLDNPEVKTVLYNYIDQILPATRTIAKNFNNSLDNSLDAFEFRFILLIILNFMIVLVSSTWAVATLNGIELQKTNVLFLFLEIPPKNVEGISKRRDRFIEFFESVNKQEQNQVEDHSTESDVTLDDKGDSKGVFDSSLQNGIISNSNNNSTEEQEEQSKNRKKLIKKYRSANFQKTKIGLLRVLIVTGVGILYSISSSIHLIVTKNILQNYTVQFYTNNFLSDTILTTLTTNRLMLINSSISVNGSNIVSTARNTLTILSELGDDLAPFFLYITDKDNEIENPAKKLFFGNLCTFLENTTTQADCELSLNETPKIGFFNVKNQILKKLIQQYDAFAVDPTIDPDDLITLFELNDHYMEYMFPIVLNFNTYEEDFLGDILRGAINLQEIILIIYLLSVICLVSYFWVAFVLKLGSEVWRTTRMISMIPLDVVNNIPSIKRYLKGLARKNE